MRCMVSDVILLGCSTSVSSEVIFESIMDAENVNNMLQLYRNTMIMVIRIKRKAYLTFPGTDVPRFGNGEVGS